MAQQPSTIAVPTMASPQNPPSGGTVATPPADSSPRGTGSHHPQRQPSNQQQQQQNQKHKSRSAPISFVLLLFGLALLFRILVGFGHHSGQDNHHGSKVAYGGDFEAQRHWMELTWHLPLGDWYYYDLSYWGLDYPPLTAYHSYVCGMMHHLLLGPETIALEESRGLEDPTYHKAFMRMTVLISELLCFAPALWLSQRPTYDRKTLWTIFGALIQPAIILVDHGHFQYNTVALGLSLLSFVYMTKDDTFFPSCVVGGILFSLALNFKQMTLYYAPPVFCYLLGRCLAKDERRRRDQNNKDDEYDSSYDKVARTTAFVRRFTYLGGAVLLTFALLWGPLLLSKPTSPISSADIEDDHHEVPTSTVMSRALHILHRIFPLERGLFEGKVANLWCALSVKPFNIRSRIDPALQPLVALGATIVLMLPACIQSFRLGCWNSTLPPRTTTTSFLREYHRDQLLWATTSSALAFFLASFQVHEKSILLALAPCSLLLWHDPTFVDWFSVVSVWSLWPLLQVDRLQVAYVCMVSIFGSLVWFRRMGQKRMVDPSRPHFFESRWRLWSSIPSLSYLWMVGLHVAQMVRPAPNHLPDLYEVLWSVTGCVFFLIAWLGSCLQLFHSSLSNHASLATKVKMQ